MNNGITTCPLDFEVCAPSCFWWNKRCVYCSKLDDCQHVKGVLDKDLPNDTHYARVITDLCATCNEREVKSYD